ncbi:LPXTG-motif cell wall anchor domain-containing protein [Clostridium collagenovorans DSM 3089]|uniref:LPXTG-motif cell wall anchor domain-containing protein n=1 Tax=Clostridium collagenovorans DSM 3089 TaxID=1121306 RepID=A0A1M5VEP0_9CLOT|nr:LPXTG cell wall anchor domain-containing protein [Clostridium collagenovorans]SHH73574.1 LPXTG-motif cell wall anchor domain-containing protein [Clostridium collagenovorans DSM 3089]
MKRSIKVRGLICAALATCVFAISATSTFASPRKESAWPQFRGEVLNPGITDSKAPRTSAEIEEDWAVKIGSGWNYSDPIIVGQYVYITDSSNIKMLDRNTGEVIKSAPLAENIGFFSRMSYGEGKLFIPIGAGRLQCFDANTLESLWITEVTPKDMYLQALSPAVYYNGHVYMGTTNGSADKGMFYAVSAKDEDPSKVDEIKEYTWTYAPEVGKSGYYWSAGTVVGNSIVFGGEKGEVVIHNLTDNTITDKLELNEAIRSSVHYDRNLGRVFITTKAGNIHSIKINSNGTFDKSSLLTTKIGQDITSSPVTYNGRVYVGGGGISSGAGFSVLDAKTLEVIYQINDIQTQSSPILTTAYATKENKNTVYLYAFKYTNPDVIYAVKDFEGNTEPIFEEIATPSSKQYNSSSAAIDEDGSIYFKNDSGKVFKFKNTLDGAFGSEDVIKLIYKLPNTEDITLNNEVIINSALERYNDLSDAEKAKVTNYDKLQAALNKMEELKNSDKEVERLLSEIEKLPQDITLSHKEKVNELFSSYERLPESHKAKVTNINKLLDAKKTIEALEEEELIKNIIVKIDTLPELKDIVLDKEELINSIYKDFNNLTESQKEKVTNKDKILTAKAKIDKTRAEVNSIEEDIWNKINPSNITLEDKEVVYDLIKRYEALDDRDKVYVKHFDEVLEAKKIIDKLEAENPSKPVEEPGNGNDNSKPNIGGNSNNVGNNSALPQTGVSIPWEFILVGMILVISGIALSKKKRVNEK